MHELEDYAAKMQKEQGQREGTLRAVQHEASALEQKLAESNRRSDAKLRAERTRLAVRYGNQGKQLVAQKMGEKLTGGELDNSSALAVISPPTRVQPRVDDLAMDLADH